MRWKQVRSTSCMQRVQIQSTWSRVSRCTQLPRIHLEVGFKVQSTSDWRTTWTKCGNRMASWGSIIVEPARHDEEEMNVWERCRSSVGPCLIRSLATDWPGEAGRLKGWHQHREASLQISFTFKRKHQCDPWSCGATKILIVSVSCIS